MFLVNRYHFETNITSNKWWKTNYKNYSLSSIHPPTVVRRGIIALLSVWPRSRASSNARTFFVLLQIPNDIPTVRPFINNPAKDIICGWVCAFAAWTRWHIHQDCLSLAPLGRCFCVVYQVFPLRGVWRVELWGWRWSVPWSCQLLPSASWWFLSVLLLVVVVYFGFCGLICGSLGDDDRTESHVGGGVGGWKEFVRV